MTQFKKTTVAQVLDWMRNPPNRPMPLIYPPDVSMELLEHWNNKNRNLRQRVVDDMADDMLGGRWIDDVPQPICFSKNDLIDGQHRFTAACLANYDFRAWSFFGLPAEISRLIDTGRPRDLKDTLDIEAIPQSALVATALRQIYRHQNKGHHGKLHNDVGLALYKRCRRLQGRIDQAKKFDELKHSVGAVAAILWIIYEHDKDQALAFEDAWYRGFDNQKTQPVVVLEKGLRKFRVAGENVHVSKLVEWALRAYVLFVTGEKATHKKIFEQVGWPELPKKGTAPA